MEYPQQNNILSIPTISNGIVSIIGDVEYIDCGSYIIENQGQIRNISCVHSVKDDFVFDIWKNKYPEISTEDRLDRLIKKANYKDSIPCITSNQLISSIFNNSDAIEIKYYYKNKYVIGDYNPIIFWDYKNHGWNLEYFIKLEKIIPAKDHDILARDIFNIFIYNFTITPYGKQGFSHIFKNNMLNTKSVLFNRFIDLIKNYEYLS